MSIRYVNIHVVKEGDTLDSLVRDYRLSSRKAIVAVKPNLGIAEQLGRRDDLPPGLHVHIPPNAIELTMERVYKLQEIRPVLLAHFEAQRQLAMDDLRATVLAAGRPAESADVQQALDALETFVSREVERIAANFADFVSLAMAMTTTHVATARDKAVEGSASDPMCSLYWVLSPPVLAQWREAWGLELWRDKWGERQGAEAWQYLERYSNAVSSTVMQQMDQRMREALALKQRLLSESGP